MVIAPQQEGKGRSFTATCLATIEAGALWQGGDNKSDLLRPAWAMFAGSENELRPFMANLTLGRRALIHGKQYSRRSSDGALEFLKSAGFSVSWQREAEGAIATIFLPDLFSLDPGMVDPSGIRFVLAPPSSWLQAQVVNAGPAVKHAARLGYPIKEEDLAPLVPFAMLFCAYVDRRTRCPIPSGDRFPLQLMLACLSNGLASWPTLDRSTYRDREFGQHSRMLFIAKETETVGLDRVLAFEAKHETFEALLAAEVARYFDLTKGKG